MSTDSFFGDLSSAYRMSREYPSEYDAIDEGDVLADLLGALKDLTTRCDSEEGVLVDGSNLGTAWAHAAIARAEELIDG